MMPQPDPPAKPFSRAGLVPHVIDLLPKDGQLVCFCCEKTAPWEPEVSVSGNYLCCGEFSGKIDGDRFATLVCSGYNGEVWERTLDLVDLVQLRTLLAAAEAEIRRRKRESKERHERPAAQERAK